MRSAGNPPLLVLLPGMDGTGTLFLDLQDALTLQGLESTVVAYACDDSCEYEVLAGSVSTQVPADRDIVLVGESYSGPLAILLASRGGARVRGLVLCGTFARYPAPQSLRWLAHRFLALPVPLVPPRLVIRLLLAGLDSPAELVDAAAAAIRSVTANALRARIRNVLAVDVSEALLRVRVPVLYLQASRDRLVGAPAQEEVVRAQPSARTVLVDAPHLLLQTCPAEAAAAIADFVDALPRGRPAGSEGVSPS